MYPKLVTYLCFMLMQQLRAFGYALNGIGLFFWKERHAKIHAVAALFIIILSFYLNITSSEWLWVLLCITLVIVSEMINTAIETYKKYGVKVGFCGQQPSDSIEFCEFLVKAGIDSISVTSDSAIKTYQKLSSM